MSIKKKFFVSISLILFVFSQAFAGHCVNWPEDVFVPKVNDKGQKLPDYGLYWFKSDGSTQAKEYVMKACDYADPKCQVEELGYFDPKKPTIIFIHGWVPFSVESKARFDFCYQYPMGNDNLSPVYNTLASWKDHNVAVFYWNQFADEFQIFFPEEPLAAIEAKIYGTKGSQNMQWKYLDEKGREHTCMPDDETCVTPNKGIADLAFESYHNALPKAYAQSITIAGQSLGTQVAIQLTAKIMQDTALPQPTSLVLMDPFFSLDGRFTKKNNLPFSLARYNTDTVAYIIQMYHQRHPLSETKFPIFVYRTSELSYPPLGNPASLLMGQTFYMRIYPNYIQGVSGLKLRMLEHLSSVYIYFNFKGAPPKGELETFTPPQ